MDAPGFGIVGLGAVSDIHAAAIRAIGEKRLVACCSRDAAKAAAFAAKYGCVGYSSLKEFLSHQRLDIVAITTASGFHLEPALAAIAAGKHLLIEKPLEVSLERCDQLIEAAAHRRVIIGGIFQSRYHAVARAIKDALNRGRFGRLVLGDAYVKWFRNQAYYDRTAQRGTWAYDGGGALMNQGIHAVDLLQWYMGPVKSVQAYAATVGHERVEVEDNAVVAVHFENGAFGVIEGSTSVYPGYPKRIEISGTLGTAILEENTLRAWEFAQKDPQDAEMLKKYGSSEAPSGGAADPMAISFSGHQLQYEEMIRCVEQGGTPLVDAHEARKSVAIILAAYHSARVHAEVEV
jgi:UDP-N-acetyl-2-amino-2-deoxyglucuronate dehydrogenase